MPLNKIVIIAELFGAKAQNKKFYKYIFCGRGLVCQCEFLEFGSF